MGDIALKHQTRKVCKPYDDSVLVGFLVATADALPLLDQLEGHLEQFNGNLERATYELCRDWCTDHYLRRLEAMIVVMDASRLASIWGEGDLLAPDYEILAVGSGAHFALAADGVGLRFSPDTVRAVARCAYEANMAIENVGDRRRRSVLSTLLEDVIFDALAVSKKRIDIANRYVSEKLGNYLEGEDLSCYVL